MGCGGLPATWPQRGVSALGATLKLDKGTGPRVKPAPQSRALQRRQVRVSPWRATSAVGLIVAIGSERIRLGSPECAGKPRWD